jgi:hypothetical protein
VRINDAQRHPDAGRTHGSRAEAAAPPAGRRRERSGEAPPPQAGAGDGRPAAGRGPPGPQPPLPRPLAPAPPSARPSRGAGGLEGGGLCCLLGHGRSEGPVVRLGRPDSAPEPGALEALLPVARFPATPARPARVVAGQRVVIWDAGSDLLPRRGSDSDSR